LKFICFGRSENKRKEREIVVRRGQNILCTCQTAKLLAYFYQIRKGSVTWYVRLTFMGFTFNMFWLCNYCAHEYCAKIYEIYMHEFHAQCVWIVHIKFAKIIIQYENMINLKGSYITLIIKDKISRACQKASPTVTKS
jgi:hypothetical protein